MDFWRDWDCLRSNGLRERTGPLGKPVWNRGPLEWGVSAEKQTSGGCWSALLRGWSAFMMLRTKEEKMDPAADSHSIAWIRRLLTVSNSPLLFHFPSFGVYVWVSMCVHVGTLSCVRLLGSHGLQPDRLLYPWDFPDKNTGVDCHFLPQEIFLTQGLNQHLQHCRQILCCWATREAHLLF